MFTCAQREVKASAALRDEALRGEKREHDVGWTLVYFVAGANCAERARVVGEPCEKIEVRDGDG